MENKQILGQDQVCNWSKLSLRSIDPLRESYRKYFYNRWNFDVIDGYKKGESIGISFVATAIDPKFNGLVDNSRAIIERLKAALNLDKIDDYSAFENIPFWTQLNEKTFESDGYKTTYYNVAKPFQTTILACSAYADRMSGVRSDDVLRYYQRDAVTSTLDSISENRNPVIVVPTGGGKTAIICAIAEERSKQGRVLILANRKELLDQTSGSFERFAPKIAEKVGVLSAGLKRFEDRKRVVVASIQTICASGRLEKILNYDAFGTIIIDEAHLVPFPDENATSEFLRVINENRKLNENSVVVGLTATPYRMKGGLLVDYENPVDGAVFNDVSSYVGIQELISEGFLTPLVSQIPETNVKQSFHIVNGDFDPNEVTNEYTRRDIIGETVSDIAKKTIDRRSVLIFCCAIRHAVDVKNELERTLHAEVGIITGETPSEERDKTIERFKSRDLKYLCNVDVLTTGFDARCIDTIVLLRPTCSPGLYAQMVGRGLRLYEGKENCLVLDYGGNVTRHGQIDKISPRRRDEKTRDYLKRIAMENPIKVCPRCQTVVSARSVSCPYCNELLMDYSDKHSSVSSNQNILSDESESIVRVIRDEYKISISKSGNEMFVISHVCEGTNPRINEYLTFDSKEGRLYRPAFYTWKRFTSAEAPSTPISALVYAREGGLSIPSFLRVKRDDSRRIVVDERMDSKKRKIKPAVDNYKIFNSLSFGGKIACNKCNENKNFIVIDLNDRFEIRCQICNNIIDSRPYSNDFEKRMIQNEFASKQIPVTNAVTVSELDIFATKRRESKKMVDNNNGRKVDWKYKKVVKKNQSLFV